ncbi:hypothetical protein L6452_39432 [Arctium lappa]|uniref:Uncharacterized protein n=1 Tax=Arctium lappa TaxID=4217 RepID=A0ACB8XSA1_ARCLA|nr:hypothetical protein L6452_39432 [Arctium lappa]
MVKDCQELSSDGNVLGVLAHKPDAFFKTKPGIIQGTILSEKPKNEIDDILRGLPDRIKPPFGNDDQALEAKKSISSRILFVAAEIGNTKFLVELIRLYYDITWKVALVSKLITPLRDGNGNNMLHLVGKRTNKPFQDVGGLALHMQ